MFAVREGGSQDHPKHSAHAQEKEIEHWQAGLGHRYLGVDVDLLFLIVSTPLASNERGQFLSFFG